MVHQLVRYVSVLLGSIGTVVVDDGLHRRAQHNGLANYVAIHRDVLPAGLVMPQPWEISMSKSDTTLYELPRDVLTVLRRELCDARAGTWELRPDANGVDVDFCEMLEETIALIERLTHE